MRLLVTTDVLALVDAREVGAIEFARPFFAGIMPKSNKRHTAEWGTAANLPITKGSTDATLRHVLE